MTKQEEQAARGKWTRRHLLDALGTLATAARGNHIDLMPPDKSAAYFRSEMRKCAAIVKGAGLHPASRPGVIEAIGEAGASGHKMPVQP